MNCWNCHALIEEKIGFRAQCEKCLIDLHVCVNCRHYSRGKPNDCNIPGTDFVADRERANFCEDFSPLKAVKEKSSKTHEDVAKTLFGENDPSDTIKSFDSLFQDNE